MSMNQTSKRKSKLLKYLPKAASAVSFQNPIFSPGRDKQKLYSSSGFSGPIVSIIPDEARRRPRRSRPGDDDYDVGLGSTQEPSSPKVSCIGQIKLHKEKKKKKKEKMMAHMRDDTHHNGKREGKVKKQDSKILKIFRVGLGPRTGKSKSSAGDSGVSAHSEPNPSLGQMKRFASGRQSLANFDWTAQIAPVNDLDDRNCHSDEEFGRYSDEEEEEIIIPFSAPMVMGTTKPREEVNLWRRRNTTSPLPLQLKPIKVRAE